MNFSCSELPDKKFLPDFGSWNITADEYKTLYNKNNATDISVSVVCSENYEPIPQPDQRAYMKCSSDGNWNWYLNDQTAINDISDNLPCCREIHWNRFEGNAANISCSRTKDDVREYYSQVDPCGNLYYTIGNEEINEYFLFKKYL